MPTHMKMHNTPKRPLTRLPLAHNKGLLEVRHSNPRADQPVPTEGHSHTRLGVRMHVRWCAAVGRAGGKCERRAQTPSLHPHVIRVHRSTSLRDWLLTTEHRAAVEPGPLDSGPCLAQAGRANRAQVSLHRALCRPNRAQLWGGTGPLIRLTPPRIWPSTNPIWWRAEAAKKPPHIWSSRASTWSNTSETRPSPPQLYGRNQP